MTFVFETDDMGRDYSELVDAIVTHGHQTSPREQRTYEIENAVIHLTNPRNALPVGNGRKYSRKILAAELMQWMSGTSDLLQLRSVSKEGFLNYSDDGHRLYGAYGPRAYSTLERAVRKLAEDPDTRQAIAVLWNGEEADTTRDLPCTLSWGFRIRDNQLHMTTSMRSSDVWRGITYDVPCMTRIGSAVAWALGVEFTDYFHLAYSLHIYDSDVEASHSLVRGGDDHAQPPMLSDGLEGRRDDAVFEESNSPRRAGAAMSRWLLLRDVLAIKAMNGDEDLPAGFSYYADLLRGTPRYDHFCDTCRYWLPGPELFCASTT